MAEIDVLKAQIFRQDLNTPWGFVLHGGLDQGTPLKINSLTPGSPAARIGLKCGDEVTEVGDLPTDGLTYQQVHDLIDRHGDTLILTVERRARGSLPVAPVTNATEIDQTKDYQPYDMSGAQQHQPTVIPVVFEEQTPVEMSAPAEPTAATAETPAEPTQAVAEPVEAEVAPAQVLVVETPQEVAQPEVISVAPEVAPAELGVAPEQPVVAATPQEVAHVPQEVAPAPVQVSKDQVQETQAPVQIAQAPVQIAQAPVQVAQAPMQVAQAPAQVAQAPAQVAQEPVQVAQAPALQQPQLPQQPQYAQQPQQAVYQQAVPTYEQHAPVLAVQPQAPSNQQQPHTQGRRQRVRTRPQPQHQATPISQAVMGQQKPQYAPVQFNPSNPTSTPIVGPPVDDNSVAILRSPDQEPISDLGPVVLAGGPRVVPENRTAPKDYQTYDLNGPRYYTPGQAVKTPNFQFETARARPFVEQQQPRQYYQPQQQQQQQPSPPPLVAPQPPPQQQYAPPPQQQQYSPRGYEYQDHQAPARVAPEEEGFHPVQSRTFKVLESLMSSDEPAAGVQGLPRQRSVSSEQWKAEQNAKRGSPRVKVFMPQQYNSPLGMYSAKNVVETFQAQAETVMDSMERYDDQTQMSAVQRALMES